MEAQQQQQRPSLPTSVSSSSLLSTKRSVDEVEREQQPMFQEQLRTRILAPVPKRRMTQSEENGSNDDGMAMEDTSSSYPDSDALHAFDPALAQHQLELQQQQAQFQQQAQQFGTQFGKEQQSANPNLFNATINNSAPHAASNGLTLSPFPFPTIVDLGTSSSLNSPAVSTFSSIAPSTLNNDADSFLFDEQDFPPNNERDDDEMMEVQGSGALGGFGNGERKIAMIRKKGTYNGYDGGMGSDIEDDDDDEIDWSARYTGNTGCSGGYSCNHLSGHA